MAESIHQLDVGTYEDLLTVGYFQLTFEVIFLNKARKRLQRGTISIL